MADEEEKESEQTIVFTYKPSRMFRVIKVDGAWGGVTPRMDIQMGVYSERLAMPDLEEFNVNDEGLGSKIRTERQTPGPIREIEAMLSMNPAVARSVAAWLNQKADDLEKTIHQEMEQRGITISEKEVIESVK